MVLSRDEEILHVMSCPGNVRNMAVIAHVDHGKTTLTDSLLSRAGVISESQAGGKRATDTRKDEQLRGITIKSTAVSLLFERNDNTVTSGETVDNVLVNLIDSPGHVDFSSEVTAALRVTDGALVVVDAISGVCVQTETVLRQALSEAVKPALIINKLDRCVLEKQLEAEELYQNLRRIIVKTNALIATYRAPDCAMGDVTMDPVSGNVAFGAGLHGWAFTIPQMARIYAAKMKADPEKLSARLWGDHFYNAELRKWRKHNGSGYVRGFNKFVLEPIYKLLRACASEDTADLLTLTDKLDIRLPAEEHQLTGKLLMKAVMRRWLPAGDAMLDVIVNHLPSPVQAQRYRVDRLYEGPRDDEVAIAMKECDPKGPLMVYISKMVPTTDKGRFFAFGRVFSGTVSTSQKVTILGPDFTPGSTRDVYADKSVMRTVIMTGSTVAAVGAVPCGNVCGLLGIDKYLVKTGTLTTSPHAHNMKILKFSVSPVVRMAVEPENASDLPKLIEGLKSLAKSDPVLHVSMEHGQNIVAGAGELHLEICLTDLEMYAGIPIKKSEPVVNYMESVSETSSITCLGKSPNKKNRLYMTAQPLDANLIRDIEDGTVFPTQDVKERARFLADEYGWDVTEARRIWSFGPQGRGSNLLVDCTKGVQGLADIKDAVIAGFQWATEEGVLCEETVRGVRINIHDAMIHRDPACRKGGQIIPTARRCVIAAILTAQPVLLEPVYMVEVQCAEDAVGGVYSVLGKRRGHVVEEGQSQSSPLAEVKAHLPVNESFGFTEDLRSATGGKAFPQCVFDHWQVLAGSPLDADTKAANVTLQVRRRKGLSDAVPGLEMFLDKL